MATPCYPHSGEGSPINPSACDMTGPDESEMSSTTSRTINQC